MCDCAEAYYVKEGKKIPTPPLHNCQYVRARNQAADREWVAAGGDVGVVFLAPNYTGISKARRGEVESNYLARMRAWRYHG